MPRDTRLTVGFKGDLIAQRRALVTGTYQADESTTGLLPGSTYDSLTILAGEQIITTPGTLIENKRITGNVESRTNDVTLRNCLIEGDPAGPPNGQGQGRALVKAGTGCLRLRLEDCVIRPSRPHYNYTGIYARDFEALRCHIYRCVDLGGTWGTAGADNKAMFYGCLLEQMTLFYPDPNHYNADPLIDNRTHNDGVQLQGARLTVLVGNTFRSQLESWPVEENFVAATSNPYTNPPCGFAPPHFYAASGKVQATAAIQATPNVSTIADNLITDNWFYGGATGINFADTGAAAGSSGVAATILRNHFDGWCGLNGTAGSNTQTTGRTINIGQNWLPLIPDVAIIGDNTYLDGTPVVVRLAQNNN